MELFYVPDKSLCSQKNKVISEGFVEGLVSDWHMSEAFKSDKKSYGSLLNNDLAWQAKWYLKFDPPKSASDLGIYQYWSYEAPKLSDFATMSDFDTKTGNADPLSHLGKSSLSALKNMATVILSGTTQDSLKREAYRKDVYKADSEVDHGSTFSAALKMPTNESGQTKLSILERFRLSANKAQKQKILHSKRK